MIRFRDMVLRDPSDRDLEHVLRRLRADDRRECYALRLEESAEALIAHFGDVRALAYAMYAAFWVHAPSAIALFGVVQTSPGAGQALLVATDDFHRIARPITRYIRDVFVPTLVLAGLRRVQVHAMADLAGNCRWIEMLGARFEAACCGLGKDGQTFNQYVWLKEDFTCAVS